MSTKVNRQTNIADTLAKLEAAIARIDGAKTDVTAELNFIEPLTGEGESATDSVAGYTLVTGYRLDSAGGGKAGFYLDASYSTGTGELDL